jgi:adenine-specific DNA methylase
MQERHINIAMKMQQAVAERLMEDEQPKLSNRDIDRWLEKAVRIERMARGINDGPRVAINVNQQQAQQSTTATVINDAQRTIAEMIASDPSILSLMNSEIDGLLGAVEEYSTGNEPAQVLSGE